MDAGVDGGGPVGGLLDQQQPEFVASEPADGVTGASGIAQQPRDGLQQPVPGPVSERVVDPLQPADIGVGQRERPLVAAGSRQLPLGLVDEAPAVEHSGQRIGERGLGQTGDLRPLPAHAPDADQCQATGERRQQQGAPEADPDHVRHHPLDGMMTSGGIAGRDGGAGVAPETLPRRGPPGVRP